MDKTPSLPDFSFPPGLKVISKIGEGAMGIVFLCLQEKINRHVAVKVLHPQFTHNQNANRKFEEEARIVAGMKHPNIVSVYDLIFYNGRYFLIMEYCDGESLLSAVNKKKFSLKETLSVILQLLKALEHAHEKQIVHHDIKLSNVIELRNGGIVLCDFGLSNIRTHSRVASMIGTLIYMPPEKVNPCFKSDKEELSDLFSLGVLFYNLLTGRYPFYGDTKEKLIEHISSGGFIPPAELAPGIPVAVNAIIIKLLQKEPSKRYLSAAELKKDIMKLQEKKTISVLKDYKIYRLYSFFLRHRLKMVLCVVIFLGFFYVIWSIIHTKDHSIQIKDKDNPEFDKGLTTFFLEKRWKCLHPLIISEIKSSHFGDLFSLKNGVLTSLRKDPFLLFYQNGAKDFSFHLTVASEQGEGVGLFYGNDIKEENGHRGLYFNFSSKGIRVTYPRLDAFEIEKYAQELFFPVKIQMVREFPFLKLIIDEKKVLEFDLTEFPAYHRLKNAGFYSLCAKNQFISLKWISKMKPFYRSPLLLPLDFIQKGEWEKGIEELSRLKGIYQENSLLDDINYWLGISYFYSFRKDISAFLDKCLVEMAESSKKDRIFFFRKWLSFLENEVSLTEIEYPGKKRDEVNKKLLLLYLGYLSQDQYGEGKFENIFYAFFENMSEYRDHLLTPFLKIAEKKIQAAPLEALRFWEKYSPEFSQVQKEARFTLLMSLGGKLKEEKCFKEAIQVYHQLDQTFRNVFPAERLVPLWFSLSECYRRTGDFKKSRAFLERAALGQ